MLLSPEIRSIINLRIGNSTGGVASPVSPYKYFLRVVRLVSLSPTRFSALILPIAAENVFATFATVRLGRLIAPSAPSSTPSIIIGNATYSLTV